MVNKIEVVSPDEAEDCDFYVCVPLTNPMTFPDNLIDECCKCHQAIQHRPHYPVGVKKICLTCVTPDIEKEIEQGNLNMMITPETAKEVAAYFHKKSAN